MELEVGHSLDDDAAVRMLADRALRGREPEDAGRAPYQVAVTVCQECGRGSRDGSGKSFDLEPHQIEAACCDAQTIDLTDAAHVGHGRATQSIPPRVRRLVLRRAGGRCQVPGCREAKFLAIHHVRWREHGGGHDPSNLMICCSAHHARVHLGQLRVEGRAPDGLVLRHADGTRYGQRDKQPSPDATDAMDGLRKIGVAAGDARRAVAAAVEAGAAAADG
jgi:hypothetical protein